MVYRVAVAADLLGQKCNFLLEFASPANVDELTAASEAVCDTSQRLQRSADDADCPFRVDRFAVYDIAAGKWAALDGSKPLPDGSQLYAFQASKQGAESVAELPAPQRVTAWSPAAAPVLPRRCLPPLSPRRRGDQLKAALTNGADRRVRYWDLREGLQRAGMVLTVDSPASLFDQADTDRDGELSTAEWLLLCARNPLLRDSLYCRLLDASSDHPTAAEVLDRAIEAERRRVTELERASRALQRERQQAAMDRLQTGRSALVTSAELREKELLQARRLPAAQSRKQRPGGLASPQRLRRLAEGKSAHVTSFEVKRAEKKRAEAEAAEVVAAADPPRRPTPFRGSVRGGYSSPLLRTPLPRSPLSGGQLMSPQPGAGPQFAPPGSSPPQPRHPATSPKRPAAPRTAQLLSTAQ
eukprot:TRINITY_DN6062_c0_g1_i1.p1 TRINITY_DN6062_c0_g1~~TRINITY_DN6062_c0_g1_i1.p1  ORF type:complete len:425 (+),score=156.12 TRINITY_DN6062_c0_g1_i1:37-1275(+)